MNNAWRTYFFLVSLLGFTLFLIASFLTLPPYSHSQNSYRNIILADDPVHIKAANAVAAVAFDYRCFDSFVEAIILFTTVAGIMLLLRKGKGEKEEYSLQKRIKKTISTRSSATATMGWALLGFVALFGFYMILHAQLSPGGGFQGGVIISSALLLIYLAGTYTKFMKQLSLRMMEMIETLGLIGFMTLGSIPLFHQKPFLTNFLPKGMLGNILSAGILMPLNILVGITVTAAIIQILHEFMEQLIITKRHNTRKKNS